MFPSDSAGSHSIRSQHAKAERVSKPHLTVFKKKITCAAIDCDINTPDRQILDAGEIPESEAPCAISACHGAITGRIVRAGEVLPVWTRDRR